MFYSTSFRVLYVAGREGLMPKLMSMIHLRKKTPIPAAIFTVSDRFLADDIYLANNMLCKGHLKL